MPELSGKRVLVTRPRAQMAEFAAALQAAGAEPVCLPVIEIGPAPDPIALDRALLKLGCYDWLALTSVNGVDAVWKRLQALHLTDLPPTLRVAAIGPKTAEALAGRGVTPDFVPEEYVAEALLPGLGDLRGRWVLLPRADLARPALAEAIRAAGGVAHEIAAYRTLPARPDPAGLEALKAGTDVVTFTSSSTVRNFAALASAAGLDPLRLPGSPVFACIGPITAATAQGEGFVVSVVAQEYTTAGLVQALETYFKKTQKGTQ
ncbi:MAG TPA: uroporphyrinogen-III synthase [Anaerolineales bacterium]